MSKCLFCVAACSMGAPGRWQEASRKSTSPVVLLALADHRTLTMIKWDGVVKQDQPHSVTQSPLDNSKWIEKEKTHLYIYTPYRYMFIVSIIIFRLSYRVCYSLMFIHTEVSIMCVHVNDVYIGKFVLVTSPIMSFWLKLVHHIWNAMPMMRFW